MYEKAELKQIESLKLPIPFNYKDISSATINFFLPDTRMRNDHKIKVELRMFCRKGNRNDIQFFLITEGGLDREDYDL